MAYVTDKAICLRVTDFSETSQIVAMFTQGHGLVALLAKGAKRHSSSGKGSISGPLDLLAGGEVMFIPAKGGELGTLCGWQLADQRTALRRDLAALQGAFVAAEVTLGVLGPHDPHPELMAELEATLELLATSERPRVLVAYAKAALTAAGYGPQLAGCCVCGEVVEMEGKYRYSPAAGGVVCMKCARGAVPAGRMMGVSGRIAVALERLAGPAALRQRKPERGADAGALRTALLLLLFHLETVTERGMRTRALLEGVFGIASGGAGEE
jgi:DNA repair protein RecO (recombination protein O)